VRPAACATSPYTVTRPANRRVRPARALPWASEYRGKTCIVYGHTPVPAPPEWLNDTLNLGHRLRLRRPPVRVALPEKEVVSVPAARIYAEPARPFLGETALTSAPRNSRIGEGKA
jgi:hypothetical protein